MESVSKFLIDFSGFLDFSAKKISGAAFRLSPEMAISQADCEDQNWQNVRPCFVLSTGRNGTLLLNNLLQSAKNVFPIHQPSPELMRPSKLAYENISTHAEIFREIFKSAREEYLLQAARRQKVFIETNNRITFFAPIIRDVFPNSVFIHLVRHPGDFVRSGIRRKWYSGEHDHDIGRIVPTSGEMKKLWQELSLIEKIGWLWNETNQFIEDFQKKKSPEDFMFVKAEELFSQPQITKNTFSFLKLDGFESKAVTKVLKKPANVQRKGHFPKYENWDNNDKERLRRFVPLAEKYGYQV